MAINWGEIASGATFEHLVQVLICREDSKAFPFGRPGKDGGQDVRSGDGLTVFQAKFHQNASGTAAISDAKKEATKIRRYRQPEDARSKQWAGVMKWQLVTNAQLNPTAKARWDTEIVPLFTSLGIDAECCPAERLEERIIAYPDILESFFGGETRIFLSIGEITERFQNASPLHFGAPVTAFQGREPELAALRSFVESDRIFFLAHGAGAVGKTRLLLEIGAELAAAGAWQVLWGLLDCPAWSRLAERMEALRNECNNLTTRRHRCHSSVFREEEISLSKSALAIARDKGYA